MMKPGVRIYTRFSNRRKIHAVKSEITEFIK